MITTETMYENYTSTLKEQIKATKSDLHRIERTKEEAHKKLQSLETFIQRCTSLPFGEIYKLRIHHVNHIKFGLIPVDNVANGDKAHFLSCLRTFIAAKREVAYLKAKLKTLEQSLISYQVYSYVIREFNKQMVEHILTGYAYDFGHRISEIKICYKVRKPRVTESGKELLPVNWGETNKLKAQIIADGKTPMSKEHPDGVPYLIYFVSEHECWWWWSKKTCNLTNKMLYSFEPTKGKHGNVKRLRQLQAKDSLAYLRFHQHTYGNSKQSESHS